MENGTRRAEARRQGRSSAPLAVIVVAVCAGALVAQQQSITAWISGPQGKPALAIPDFRASGGAQPFMDAFNSTLRSDLQDSGLFDIQPKSFYPPNNPQRPEDLRPEDNHMGYALQDWGGPPTKASHLVFGYAAAINGALALYGNVYDTRVTNLQGAQLFAKNYAGSLDQAGAVRVAHEFANDIIQKFGGSGSLVGSRIYFVSNRTSGPNDSEIWAMDWDGNNQTQLTNLHSLSIMPSVSPDGSRVAFTTYAKGTPRIMIVNTENKRLLPFYNQEASMNATATFTPDGKQLYYASSAAGLAQIFAANLNGEDFRRISHRSDIEMEPKVDPKNPNILLFVSGAGGSEQIYTMDANGGNVQRVTNGEGEASNPSWNPDGQHIAFSWTRGYARGDWNVFVMDISQPSQYAQLTHSEGRNENPSWGPDGRHIVFASTRGGRSQIYTMLADGSQVTRLTQQGTNKSPVWGTK
jgi:TolB protein